MAQSDFTAVSIKADKEYIKGLRILAMSRRTSIGELVREACDKVHADAVADARRKSEVFFADGGTEANRLEDIHSKRKGSAR